MLKEIDSGHKLLDEPDAQTSSYPSPSARDVESGAVGYRTPDGMLTTPSSPAVPAEPQDRRETKPILAIFCYENPDSPIGRRVTHLADALAQRQVAVHLFTRHDFDLESKNVASHPVGDGEDNDLVASVQEFASRSCNALMKVFQDVSDPITLMGHEWSSIPAMSLLRGLKTLRFILSLDSLERQRTAMTSETSRQIDAIELSGLREAKDLLVNNAATATMIQSLVPECTDRIAHLDVAFPVHDVDAGLDPGAVKGRYQVGPMDPMILFVGDLNERYGPDILVKSLPPVLKNHGQARLVIVGEGELYWPLRVYTRYLLLEHAVRLVGSVQGQALRELIQAADVVVVPSRGETPWWPIQAAWGTRRPVVATHQAAPGLLEHEQDGVLFYPSENSCVWGIERVLYDADLGKNMGENGYAKFDERFGWSNMAARVLERMTMPAGR